MAQVVFNGDFRVGSLSTETVKIDLSTKTRSVKFSRNGETLDASAFGDTSKKWAKGLIDADVTVELYYDATVWLHMQNLLGDTTAADWQYGPEGTTSGNRKVTGTGTSGGLFLTKVDDDTTIGTMKMLNVTFKVNGTPTLGTY